MGRKFYPLDPKPEDVDLVDIAHALAMTCRFGGHSDRFYSVAEHSVQVARFIEMKLKLTSLRGGNLVPPSLTSRDVILWGLLHDAAEAYVGDMVWPLKKAEEVRKFSEIEDRIMRCIAEHFGLPGSQPSIVKEADLVLLATEKRDLFPRKNHVSTIAREAEKAGWHCDGFTPLEQRLVCWEPVRAKAEFLSMFVECSYPDRHRERDRPREETFVCATCKRTVGTDVGGFDDYPDDCDECANAKYEAAGLANEARIKDQLVREAPR